jgi:predicted phosphodiesterase
MAQGGPQPAECLELLWTAGARVVLGNSDAFLLAAGASEEPATELQLEARDWSLSQLDRTVELDLDGLRLLCFHGTPRSYDEVVLPEDPPDPFDGTGADRLAGGHVHVPQLRRVGAAALYVNPGSVGLGYDHLQPDDDFRFDPWASFAVLDSRSVEFHRIPFDLGELDVVTRASGLPRSGDVFDRYRR